ncbi:MAG TPA: hypothetical protein VMI31_02940 [Fimbriimonadaceae bacterium]|nr:hypothetical protein [Fimbriimonadaceae bacterium]
MVQDFVDAAYRWVLGTADIVRQLLPLIVFGILAAAAVWLAYRKIDPEGQAEFGKRLRSGSGHAGRAALVALATLVLGGLLVQAGKTVQSRRDTIEQATASRRREPNLSGIVQFAPAIALVEDKTYTRSLTLPPDFATRIGAEGIQVLAPYLSDPSSDNVLKLVDSFKRSGQDVVFTRQLTRRDELPVAADGAEIKVVFHDEGAPSGRRHYNAEFTGEYRFRNPRPDAAPMRFVFDLPEGGGTVQEFYIEILGTRMMEPDEQGVYAWNGTIPAGQTVTAHVHYRVSGAAEYDYRLGSERRRIGDFHLVTMCPQPPQYAKSGIYPTSLSGAQSEWRLKDVLTSQSISLVFPRADLQSQLLNKTISVLPAALALFALAALLLCSDRAFWGSAAFGVALLAVPVLSAYLTPAVATVIGAVLAAAAGGLVLRNPRGWIVSILAAALTTVFLTVEHGGLAAWIIAVVAVGLIALQRPAKEPQI